MFTITENNQLTRIKLYIEELFRKDASGHDFEHMKRVAKLAKEIAIDEGADVFITEAAAWLHDVGDYKLFDDPDRALQELSSFLQSLSLTDREINDIENIITKISFSKGNIPETLEGKIVQDADRIDAIGAIGIARTFAFGGAAGQLIYHEKNKNTSIQHFYDKLLTLAELMHTEKGREIAKERHHFMEEFLEQFFTEWDV
ncbi:HD domain-containing protein [Oceanobacillus bengalensis]|uniref:HD domain-containing protein n=2 Tax=Oceanobacillus bengalensis TaxID=1435466 RepID=A0A494YUW5_9BACI|nr:HD domain-containing protein [Oceanobacillus bengalensis]